MSPVLIVNLVTVALAVILPNDFLKWHSYVLYGIQLCTLVPYLARRAFFAENVFIPTFFVLVYLLINLTFGGYLVPRGFGIEKQYADVATGITTYNLIVPYLLLANIVLFLVTISTIGTVSRAPWALLRMSTAVPTRTTTALGVIAELVCFAAFLAVTYFQVYSAFSFQMAILVVHLSEVSRRRSRHRYVLYATYLLVLAGMDFDNKREIAMVLFLMVFLELRYGGHLLRTTPKHLVAYLSMGSVFLTLIMVASILRGYGNFAPSSLLDAMVLVPRYIRSDLFVDGLTDNLELNYHYGSAITSIDLTIRGIIPYQFGASLWKVLFLPIPRELFPAKPVSVMQLYTQTYAPWFWASDGSLPVAFSSEMFVNFSLLGLLPFALVWGAINRFFVRVRVSNPGSFMYYSCVFLIVTVLMFARGSGIEQYLLYYLLGAPVLLLAAVVRRQVSSRTHDPEPASAPATATSALESAG